jgi:hypothetical protein
VVGDVATVGSNWIDSGEGTQATGPVIRVTDPCGHYPWSCPVHPEDGAFFFQGTANIQPGIVTVMHPGDWPEPYPHSDAFYEDCLEAMRMIGRGGTLIQRGTVPSFSCLMGEQGDSFLGCSSDYITSLGPAGAAAFIRKGMIGSTPRTLTDAELAPLLRYLFYNSQQHLVRGAAVVAEVDAWLAGTPAPTPEPEPQPEPDPVPTPEPQPPTSTGLPAWVPATIGEARMVPMRNRLDDVVLVHPYWSGDSAAQFCSYSGGVFNRYYGRWGAMAFHGQGHGAGQDNSVLIAKFDERGGEFARVGGPTQIDPTLRIIKRELELGRALTDDERAHEGRMMYEDAIQFGGFPDNISNPREVGPQEPGSAHTYDCLCILSPEECGDPMGALIRPVAGAIGAGVSRETGWSHAFYFTSRKWERWSTNYASAWSPGGSCLHDKVRGRIWPINEQAARMMLDTKTRTWTNFNEPNGTLKSYVDMVQSQHHVLRDIGVITTNDQGELKSRFFWFPAGGDGKARNLATFSTGDLPKANWGGGTLVDIPELGKMIFWSRYDPQRYFEIEVPADPMQPWSWVARSITGVNMAAVRCNEAVYKRFDYAPQLKSLIWVPGRNVNDFMFGGDVVCLRVH